MKPGLILPQGLYPELLPGEHSVLLLSNRSCTLAAEILRGQPGWISNDHKGKAGGFAHMDTLGLLSNDKARPLNRWLEHDKEEYMDGWQAG